MPVLLGAAAFLAYPSVLLVLAVAGATWLYLSMGGNKVDAGDVAAMRGQIAFRVLSVKLLAFNGDRDDKTFEVHALCTPDLAENSELRGTLRDVSAATPDYWQAPAKQVYAIYKGDPEALVSRLDALIVQVSAQPGSSLPSGQRQLSDDTQERLMQIAKMWRIGPKKTKELLLEARIQPSQALLAWK